MINSTGIFEHLLCARTLLDEQRPCLHGIVFQVGESHSRLSLGFCLLPPFCLAI